MGDHSPPTRYTDSPSGFIDVQEVSGVAVVSLNRPAVLNALDDRMCKELVEIFHYYADPARTSGIVLTGTGRAFSAGVDLNHFPAPPRRNGAGMGRAMEAFHEITRSVLRTRVPTAAAINGIAVGGGLENTLCFDIRIASPNASFVMPEVRLGAVMSNAASILMPAIVGRSRAAGFYFRGNSLDAEEALRIGLVDEIVEPAALVERAIEVVRSWNPPAGATPWSLELMRPSLEDVNRAMARETRIAEKLWESGVSNAGVARYWDAKRPIQSAQIEPT